MSESVHSRSSYFASLVLLAMLAAGSLAPAAEPFDDKKPKRPRFGSSLKRLKWDPARQAATEVRPEDRSARQPPSDEAIKLNTLLVLFDVLVVTRGTQQIVTGLDKDDFIITEDGRPQQVATLARGDDAARPRSIILIVDYSGSQAPYLQTSLEAAKTLVGKLAPLDEMAIVSDDVEMLIDFTSDRARLLSTLDKIKTRVFDKHKQGRSLQFTALFAALRELTGDPNTRPIIIFQTDGDEAPSFRDQPDAARFAFFRGESPPTEYGLSDIFEAAEKSRVTIYSVVTNERLIGASGDELHKRGVQLFARRGLIKPGEGTDRQTESLIALYTEGFRQGQLATVRVATISGGWTAWLQTPDEAATIYSQILSDINQRYIIGYYPTNTDRDGKLRKVSIEVKGHPEYQVHGRTTYRAPVR